MTRLIRYAAPFGIGVLMALGFVLGGVTRPETIVQFLDFTGAWNPAVIAVLVTAVITTFVLYRLIWKLRERPLFEPKFYLPTRRDIDARLLIGAALFGLGWGLVGLCPGPALASLATGAAEVLVWLGALAAGMLLFKVVDRYLAARALARMERELAKTGREPESSAA